MSDMSQPVPTRLSRRTLRERAAQMDAEKAELIEHVTPEVQVSPAVVDHEELNTAPTEAAPVSRVVRRSTTQMAPRRAVPPSPAVIQRPAAVVEHPAVIVEPALVLADAPVTGFAPVSSVADPVNTGSVAAAPMLAAGVPPWEAITSGAHPEAATLTGEIAKGQRGERHAIRSAEAARVPPPSAGYTWVQYLILLGVAFVLGLLLWQLIIGEIPIPEGIPHLSFSASVVSSVMEFRL